MATAGQTIIVESGSYGSFSISASGTSSAPITIKSMAAHGWDATAPLIEGTINVPAITVTGSYVNFAGLDAYNEFGVGFYVNGAHHLTIDSSNVRSNSGTDTTTSAVDITGTSSAVTISRTEISNYSGAGVSLEAGTADDVITTDAVSSTVTGPALQDSGAVNATIVGNGFSSDCDHGVLISGSGGSALLENDTVWVATGVSTGLCGTAQGESGIVVDATAVGTTTVDYDTVTLQVGAGYEYTWAGQNYTTAAGFSSAVGQGTHDLDVGTIDSANSSAPGELATDLYGNPRVDDPLAANTGAGTYAYYDRGAVETQEPVLISLFSQSVKKAPIGGSVTLSATVKDAWSSALTCSFDFGDGSSPIVVTPTANVCSATYAYSAAGAYAPKLTATSALGGAASSAGSVTIVPPAALTPVLSAVSDGGLVVMADASASTDAWAITKYAFDFGDGSAVTSSSAALASHTYAKPGIYPITVTETDTNGTSASGSRSFTTAAYFTALAPVRLLDTRAGTGVASAGKVAPNGIVKLQIAGRAGIPSGASAVVLNVTVTNPAAGGYVTAYPDGGSAPNTSNVNFTKAQTVPNEVVVGVGADGYVDLKNSSAGTTDLVADVAGYYATTASSGYNPIVPARLLDTRKTGKKVAAKGVVPVYVGTAYSAATLNVTVTNPAAGGYITAYPSGTSLPTASNVNFVKGQTIPNEVVVKVGADGYVDFANSSSGSTDLIVDVTGYFTVGSGLTFEPIAPTRYLDTRTRSAVPTGLGPNGYYDLSIKDQTMYSGVTIPDSAAAIAGNITVTNPTGGGYITVFPDNVGQAPTTSVVNFSPGQTVANATTVGLGPLFAEGIALFNGSGGSTDLVVDVFGYYA